jgi:hypothetical protein
MPRKAQIVMVNETVSFKIECDERESESFGAAEQDQIDSSCENGRHDVDSG